MSSTRLSDDGMHALAGYLMVSMLRKINIAANSFSLAGWLDFVKALVLSSLKEVYAGSNLLDDSFIIALSNAMNNQTQMSLDYIDIENSKITDAGAIAFLNASINANVSEINMDNSVISASYVTYLLGKLAQYNNQKVIDLSNDKYVTAQQVVSVIDLSVQTDLAAFRAVGVQLSDKDLFSISKSIASSDEDLSFMGNLNPTRDQYRTLAKLKPRGQLSELSLSFSERQGPGYRALVRALLYSGMEKWQIGNTSYVYPLSTRYQSSERMFEDNNVGQLNSQTDYSREIDIAAAIAFMVMFLFILRSLQRPVSALCRNRFFAAPDDQVVNEVKDETISNTFRS